MDWENERYVRRYVRETVDDAVLSWEAKALWAFLLDRFNRAGILPMGVHGWKGVAVLVRMPYAVVAPAAEELLADGRVQVRGTHLIAPNFMEAQEAKQSDKQRKAESRARQRDKVLAEKLGVTICDDTTGVESQNRTETAESVTAGHTASRLVTPTLPVLSLAVPSLPENSTLSGSPDLVDSAEENKPPPPKATKRKPKEKPKASEAARQAANYLRVRVLDRTPTCAASRMTAKTFEEWARRLEKLSKLSPAHGWDEIKASIDWLHDSDNTFVVQSAGSLAEKWDSIQANRSRSPITGKPKALDEYAIAESRRNRGDQ